MRSQKLKEAEEQIQKITEPDFKETCEIQADSHTRQFEEVFQMVEGYLSKTGWHAVRDETRMWQIKNHELEKQFYQKHTLLHCPSEDERRLFLEVSLACWSRFRFGLLFLNP